MTEKMTEERKRACFEEIGRSLYEFTQTLGWTSAQYAPLMCVVNDLGLLHDRTHGAQTTEEINAVVDALMQDEKVRAKIDAIGAATETTEPEAPAEPEKPPMDETALRKEARIVANAYRTKDKPGCQALIRKHGSTRGTVDSIPTTNLAAFINDVRAALN